MDDQQNVCASGPTAQEIFGLSQGCRAALKRTMPQNIFQMVASKRPDVAVVIDVLDGQTCTASIVNDDVFELRLDERHEITLSPRLLLPGPGNDFSIC